MSTRKEAMYAFRVPRPGVRGRRVIGLSAAIVASAASLAVASPAANATSQEITIGAVFPGLAYSSVPVYAPRHPLNRADVSALPANAGFTNGPSCVWAQNAGADTPAPTRSLILDTTTYINNHNGDLPPSSPGDLAGHPSCVNPADSYTTYRVYNGSSSRRGINYKAGLPQESFAYNIDGYEYW
jgi:hypothetical protein